MKINSNYMNLQESYLFFNISKKVDAYKKENPSKEIIRMGIGDVTQPLPEAVIRAIQRATLDMADKDTFRGYGDYEGCHFLRHAITNYYKDKSVTLDESEIFISDGAKSDLGNILDIFDINNNVLIPDPVYPAYVDANIMAGREITFMSGNLQNNFLPLPDESLSADIIYLCSPNNPTGAVYNKEQLKLWVDFARNTGAIILFDSAYEAFVQDKELPTSIYEVEGAKECAIEICSLSKTAGFTGTRCGYTVVPMELLVDNISINKLWLRRQTTKYNGVPYIIQRGAEAVFTEEGYCQTRQNIAYYLENAKIISKAFDEMRIWYVGGENSPYIWLKCPNGMKSWEYFDYLLTTANVVGTPGAGFGANGEGFFRLTAFGERINVIKAMERIKKVGI